MTNHRFTVNVPNPTAQRVFVQLRLQPANQQDFDWHSHKFPEAALEVTHTHIALNPCAKDGKQNLDLKLEPFTSVDIHVVINTATSEKPGVAGFHLVDRRNGKDVGGVFLVCMDPPFVKPVSQTVSTPNPCPAILVNDLYAIQPGDDPCRPSNAKSIRPGDSLELVAQITNPTGKSLKGAQVYLEHLGTSNMDFTPGTWNIGTLSKGDVFYATWPIRTSAWQVGSFEVSIVVVSQDLDPVRLYGKISVAARNG